MNAAQRKYLLGRISDEAFRKREEWHRTNVRPRRSTRDARRTINMPILTAPDIATVVKSGKIPASLVTQIKKYSKEQEKLNAQADAHKDACIKYDDTEDRVNTAIRDASQAAKDSVMLGDEANALKIIQTFTKQTFK